MFLFKAEEDELFYDELFKEQVEKLRSMYQHTKREFFPGTAPLSDAQLKIAHDFTMEAIYRANTLLREHKPEYKQQSALFDL